MNITDLPTEIILEIFTYLPQPFIITTIKQVSKRWKELSSSQIIWKNLDLYHYGLFLSMPKEKLDNLLQKNAAKVHQLRTKTTCFFTKFQPELFTELKILHLRMYDDDNFDQLRNILQCFADLETFKLDVTKFDRLTDVISLCNGLKKLRRFHLRHFFCNHSTQLKLMPYVFQVLFKNTTILTHVTVSCGDIYLDIAIQTLLERNRDLVELNLSRCSAITNVAFSSMRWSNLRSLTLHRTGVDDETLKIVADNSPYLKTLSVSKCKNITDKGMHYIAQKSKQLQNLQINDFTPTDCCQVTNTGIGYIAEGCRDLRSLNVNCHPYVDASILTPLGILCSNIRILKMEKICDINDSYLIGLAKHCVFLERVNFNDCPKITGNGVSHLLVGCKWLKHASFSSCINICDLSLGVLDGTNFSSETCTYMYNSDNETDGTTINTNRNYFEKRLNTHSHIQTLHFSCCEKMRTDSFLQLSIFCPDLNELRISGWAKENIDLGIVQILRNCNNLQLLVCFGLKENEVTNFTNESLYAMVEYGKHLKRLHFSLNHFITIDALGQVLLSCTQLEQLDLYLDDSTALSLKDIKDFVSNCDPEKIALQSYRRMSTVGCVISLHQSYNSL